MSRRRRILNESGGLSVGSGLQLWLDAADTSATNIVQSGGSVSQWTDKSGQGNNATQGTGANQPTTNVTTENGLNVLDFDGGDEFDYPSGLFAIPNGNNTQFFVVKRNTEDGGQEYFSAFAELGVANRQVLRFDSTSGSITFGNGGLGNLVTNTGNTNTNFQIVTCRRDGTTQGIAVNGGAEVTDTNAINGTPVDIGALGSVINSTFLTGSIAETLIYDRSLSANEITAVESYLSAKWNISI